MRELGEWRYAVRWTMCVCLLAVGPCMTSCSAMQWQETRDERIVDSRTRWRTELVDEVSASHRPESSTVEFDYADLITCYRKEERTKEKVDRRTLSWGWTVLDVAAGAALTVGGGYLIAQSPRSLEALSDEDESNPPIVTAGATTALTGLIWGGYGVYSVTQDHDQVTVLERRELEGEWQKADCQPERLATRKVTLALSAGEASSGVHDTSSDANGRVSIAVSRLDSIFADFQPLGRMPTLRTRPGTGEVEGSRAIHVRLPKQVRKRLRRSRTERAFEVAKTSDTLRDWLFYVNTHPERHRKEAVSRILELAPTSDDPELVLEALDAVSSTERSSEKLHDHLAGLLVEADETELYRRYARLAGDTQAIRHLEAPLFETGDLQKVFHVLSIVTPKGELPEHWHERIIEWVVEANESHVYRSYLQKTTRPRAVEYLKRALAKRGEIEPMLKALGAAAPEPDLLHALHDALASLVRKADRMEFYRQYVTALDEYDHVKQGGSDEEASASNGGPHERSILERYAVAWAEANIGRYIEDYEEDERVGEPAPPSGPAFLKKEAIRQLETRIERYHLEAAREAKRRYLRQGEIGDARWAIEHYERAEAYAEDDRKQTIEREREAAREAFRRQTSPSEVDSDLEAEMLYPSTIGRREFSRFLGQPSEFVGERVVFTASPFQKLSSTTYMVKVPRSGVPVFVRIVNNKLTSVFQRARLHRRGTVNICAIVKGRYTYKNKMGEVLKVPRVHAFWLK